MEYRHRPRICILRSPDRLVHMEEELFAILGRRVDLVEREPIEQSPNYIRRKAILSSCETVYPGVFPALAPARVARHPFRVVRFSPVCRLPPQPDLALSPGPSPESGGGGRGRGP